MEGPPLGGSVMANEPNEDEPLFHAATYTQAPKVSHKVLTKEERQVLIKQHEEKQQEAAKLDQVASKGPVGRWWSRLQSGPNRITPAMAIVALCVSIAAPWRSASGQFRGVMTTLSPKDCS